MPRRLVTIVGATATGKTALAIELARRFNGEIVNADSRQVYRGMDIGTAKPSLAEQRAVRHWLVDVSRPDETMTLAVYLDLAKAALNDIWARDKLPIVVGGTGQYLWALVEGWRVPRVAPDTELRAQLESLAARQGVEALFAILRAEDAASARTIDARNVRRVIRAIEVTRATGRPFSDWQTKDTPDYATTMLGLTLPRGKLYERIDRRVAEMLAAGLVDEVRGLNADGYGCELPAMNSIGYREICEHLHDGISLDDAAARIKTETHRLARMQHAWFRGDDARIRWLDSGSPDLADAAAAAVPGFASG